MTLVLPPQVGESATRDAATAARRRSLAIVGQPGLLERILVVLTTFVFLHRTPLTWFQTRDELLTASNPVVVVFELALIGIAFARVAGSIDYLINMIRLEPLIYLFAGLTFASMFWSADTAATLQAAVIFVAVTSYGSYLVMRFSLDQIIRLLALMFTSSALINTAFITAVPQYGIDRSGLYTGVFGQKNALGYAAVLGIPTLIIAARAYPLGRLIFYPAILLHVWLLLGSQSKTMLVATLVPVGLMGVYQMFRSRRTLRGAVLMSLGGSALFTIAFVTANIALLANYLEKDVTLTGRVPMWQNLWVIVLERPIFGHGFGAAFGGYFSPVHEVWIQNRWNPSHAHNAVIQLLLEVGVLGAIIFLMLYGRSILRAIKIVAIVPGAVGLWPLTFLTTVLMVSITEAGVTTESLGWMMLVVATLSISLHLRYRDTIGLSNDLRDATEPKPVEGLPLPAISPERLLTPP